MKSRSIWDQRVKSRSIWDQRVKSKSIWRPKGGAKLQIGQRFGSRLSLAAVRQAGMPVLTQVTQAQYESTCGCVILKMAVNLLPEFPYKSFMLTAILRITQPHVLSH